MHFLSAIAIAMSLLPFIAQAAPSKRTSFGMDTFAGTSCQTFEEYIQVGNVGANSNTFPGPRASFKVIETDGDCEVILWTGDFTGGKLTVPVSDLTVGTCFGASNGESFESFDIPSSSSSSTSTSNKQFDFIMQLLASLLASVAFLPFVVQAVAVEKRTNFGMDTFAGTSCQSFEEFIQVGDVGANANNFPGPRSSFQVIDPDGDCEVILFTEPNFSGTRVTLGVNLSVGECFGGAAGESFQSFDI
ncbi:hypothetical protein CALCODRAFT_486310, partial [Calocera cornea HHB12733]